jgi:signal transduction histidine kinase
VEVMPDGGKLKIIAHNVPSDNNHVLIKISDTGLGIPEDIKNQIFEPFFSTKKEKTGVGLGLAVVYGIIQGHKGKIWVDSQEGKGTTFFIELPLIQTNK